MKQQSDQPCLRNSSSSLSNYKKNTNDEKILALPLQFEYLPVQILSKQFTKLNSSHPYRIHYLGPRFTNTQILHKKYSHQNNSTKSYFEQLYDYEKYQIQLKKIIQSNYLNEKLKDNHYYKSAIFYRAFQGMNPTLNINEELKFNSCFESGNLDCVIKVSQFEFDLFLRIDSNTRGHAQWFYFSAQNGNKIGKYQFNICNLTKPHTLYSQQQTQVSSNLISGMRPYVFSKKKYQKFRTSWEQDGLNIAVTEKPLRYSIVDEMMDPPTVYRLTFQYQFKEEEDEVYFAYSIPYTYSQMLGDISKLESSTKHIQRDVLGKSLTGVQIPILHITNHSNKEDVKKKNILVTGRIHPGQSNGSYVLKGFIEFLCGNTEQAQILRNRINFYIVPMVNPDGVIMGNSRSSASGKDLNREYLTSKRQLYPEVVLVKTLAYKLQKLSGVFIFFDFHGHSRKKNTFLYGPVYSLSDIEYYKSRVFAKLIEKANSNFRFHSCSFIISQEKKRTARAVLFQQYRIPYVFTIESSIGLYHDSKILKTLEFTIEEWENIGSSITRGLTQFIVIHEDYQQMIKQRRLGRQKKRQKDKLKRNFSNNTKKFIEDPQEGNDEEEGSSTKCIQMFDLMQQIKNAPPKQSNNSQASSDDHDDAENLQSSKLAQFNNLVIQSKQKSKNSCNSFNKVNEEDQYQLDKPMIFKQNSKKRIDSETDQFQFMKQLQQQHNQIKKGKKTMTKFKKNIQKNSIYHNINKPPFTYSNRSKSQYSASNGFSSFPKKIEEPNQDQKFFKNRNIDGIKNSKYFQTHRHLVSKQFFPVDKCEIVDLPFHENFTMQRRKQIKKGRVIIKDYLNQKKKEKEQINISATKKKNWPVNNKFRSSSVQNTGEISKNRSSTPYSNRGSFKNMNFDILNEKNEILKRSSTFQNRKNGGTSLNSFTKNQKQILSNSNNRIFDSALFCGLQGLQVDNMAMMIRTFNR